MSNRYEDSGWPATIVFAAHYTGDARHREVAETAMRYLAAEPVASRVPASSILLAERELTSGFASSGTDRFRA